MLLKHNHGGNLTSDYRTSPVRSHKTFRLLTLPSLITLATLHAIPALSLIPFEAQASYSKLNDVRVGHHSDKVRVVFDLNQSTKYTIFTLKEPHRLVLDFNDTEMLNRVKAQLPNTWLQGTPIKRFRTGRRNQNDLRIVFDLSHDVESKSFILKSPNRLVVDIISKETRPLKKYATNSPIPKLPSPKVITKSSPTKPVPPTPKAPSKAITNAGISSRQTNPIPHTDEAPLDLRLMDYQVNKISLDDALPTYQRGNKLWLDFEAFLHASEFLITQKEKSIWQGIYFNQDKKFTLNIKKREAKSNGKNYTLYPDSLIQHEGVWLASADDLQKWFELSFTPNERNQSLKVTSNNLFPIEQRYQRYANRNRYIPTNETPIILQDNYQWLTSPRLYMQANVNHLDNDGDTTDTGSFSLTGSMDLFKHQTFYTGTITNSSGNNTNTTQRLTFSRFADSKEDWLALGASHYEVGDVFYSGNNLANRGGSGEGLVIARQKDVQTLNKGITTIAGDAPPGWDVELYRNNQLLDFSRTTRDGRYRFIDQQTAPGKNVFIIRLYGPQGQYQEQQQLIWGGGLELDPGDHNYRFTHIDYDQTLLEGKFDGADLLPASRTRSAEFSYGINSNLQAGLGYFDSQTGERDNFGEFNSERYYQANFRGNFFTGVLLGEFNQQENNGSAWQATYLGNLSDKHSYNINYQSFDKDYDSPFTVRKSKLDNQIELSLFGRGSGTFIDAYDLRLKQEDQTNGSRQDEVFNRLSRRFGPTYLSNEITYRDSNIGQESYRGALKISGRHKKYSLSGQLDYDPSDSKPATAARGTVRWQINKDLYSNIEINKLLRDNHTTIISSDITWRNKYIDVSLKASANTDDFWSVGIGLSTTLDYNRHKKSFYASRDNLADKGRAAFNVYIDENKNNKLDAKEEVVQQVKYKDLQSEQKSPSKYVPINNIPSQNTYQIDTQKVIVDDPYLIAANRYYNIYTHAGSELVFNLPVYNSGDIEGYLLRYTKPDDPDSIIPSPGIEIELRDNKGNIVAQTTSEFDGYYSFNTVPVGDYSIVTRSTKGYFQEHERFFDLDKEDNYREVDNVILTSDR